MLLRLFRRLSLFSVAAAVSLPLAANSSSGDLLFIAATNNTEPMARFVEGQMVGGLLKELGDELALRAGLRPRYLSLPSMRVAQALRAGEADVLCHVRPGWIDGDFHWSVPFLPNAVVVAARTGAKDIESLTDLKGQVVGTVLGYRYPHLLPKGMTELPFLREDAVDSRANLAKLTAGRMQYAILDELAVRDWVKRKPDSGVRVSLIVARYSAQCAQSKLSRVDPRRVQAALGQMIKDGSVRRMLQRYGS